jgi:HAD superfamily hydrolase (TIGR01450 family)
MTDKQLLRKIKLFLFDQDCTLYLGDRLYDFTVPMLEMIRKTGRRYMFMTNNSSKSVADYIKKLERMGISASRDDFITSSQATAYYLKKHHPGKTLYVCGTRSLIAELECEGFSVTTDLEQVACVVMGFDTELTFRKLEDVSKLLLTRKDITYIATNPDLVCPTEFGSVPDCGSVCQMIYNASGRRPVVIGKPSSLMPELAMEHTGFGKEETAVVGDRIYTDIKSGLNAGVTGILVMSGETTPEILAASEDKPHLVLQDCSEILTALSEV